MISFPNAKINLGLNVVSKRPDGYHNIETIFYPIPVKDALEIVRADTFSFTQTGIPVDVPIEKNLVVKALNLLKSRYKIPELEVHLLKAIPFGAGLGGGSADAGRQLGRTCLLHRSGLPVLYPQYAGIRIRHGKYLRNGGIVAGRLPSLSSQAGCCRLDTGSLFDGDARSSGYLFERNHPETCRRMERIDGKRF